VTEAVRGKVNVILERAGDDWPVLFVHLAAAAESGMPDGKSAQVAGGLAVIGVSASQAHGDLGVINKIQRFSPRRRIERAGASGVLENVGGKGAEAVGAVLLVALIGRAGDSVEGGQAQTAAEKEAALRDAAVVRQAAVVIRLDEQVRDGLCKPGSNLLIGASWARGAE
jgi:hypothetical protein